MEEKICQELDDAVAAMEELNNENETKTEMCENLRAAHDEQLSKIKKAKLEIEKQAEELNAEEEELSFAEELSFVKQMYEEAKSSLQEKESTLEQLRDAHEKQKEENDEKLKIMEGRNNELMSALDDANRRLQEKEQLIQSFKDGMQCTETFVSTSQKDPAEHNTIDHDPRQGDHDLLLELDEENEEIKNQLKCKTEQFNHLHEAHEKVQDQLRVNKKEWEDERCMLIEEISSLQARLDYQTKISETLQHNMQLLNDALAQEEGRRKQLAVQVSEPNECNADVSISSHIKLPSNNAQMHDMQIEMENCYSSIMELKLQNEELHIMLTLYKSGISDAYSKLLSHPKADMELDNKEVEVKSVLIEELDQNSTFQSKSHSEYEDEREIPESLVQEDRLNTSPSKFHSEFEHEREIPESREAEELMNTSPFKSHSEFEREFEQKYLMTLKELENCIDMLEESSLQQLQLKEEALQMENALKEDIRKVREAFDNVSSELLEKIQEAVEIELELERWIAVAEHLQHCLDESLKIRKEMEVSLLSQVETEHTLKQENEHLLHLVEERDKKADGLQREMVSLNQELLKSETETATLARMVTESELDMEKDRLLQIVEEKNKNINSHRQKLYCMEQEVMRRELDGMRRELENAVFVQVQTEQSLEQERDRLLQVVKKKDGIIENLWLQITEHDLISLIKVSTMSRHEEKMVDEESEDVQFLDELETEVKNTVIMELEAEISDLELTLESNEKTMVCTKRQVEQLEAALEAKQLEMESLRSRLGTSSASEDNQEISNLSSEKGDLSGDGEACDTDKDVMSRLESFGNGDPKLTGLKVGAKYYDSDRENENGSSPHPLSTKSSETTTPDRRTQLIENPRSRPTSIHLIERVKRFFMRWKPR